MSSKHLVAFLTLALPGAVVVTSCVCVPVVPEPEERAEQAHEEMASLRNPWSFKVTREYDGQDGAGGEQEASASIGFVTETVPPHYFACSVRVRMPVQTLKYGRVSTRYAAEITLKVSDEAAEAMDWRYWGEPTNIYCQQFLEKMQSTFVERYKGLGARVTK